MLFTRRLFLVKNGLFLLPFLNYFLPIFVSRTNKHILAIIEWILVRKKVEKNSEKDNRNELKMFYTTKNNYFFQM